MSASKSFGPMPMARILSNNRLDSLIPVDAMTFCHHVNYIKDINGDITWFPGRNRYSCPWMRRLQSTQPSLDARSTPVTIKRYEQARSKSWTRKSAAGLTNRIEEESALIDMIQALLDYLVT